MLIYCIYPRTSTTISCTIKDRSATSVKHTHKIPTYKNHICKYKRLQCILPDRLQHTLHLQNSLASKYQHSLVCAITKLPPLAFLIQVGILTCPLSYLIVPTFLNKHINILVDLRPKIMLIHQSNSLITAKVPS